MHPHALTASRGPARPVRRLIVSLGAATLTASACLATPAAAAGPTFTSGTVTVEQPWSRATPHGADVAVGYVTIRNTGDAPERLVSASSDVAGRVGPHSMVMTDGVMRMRPLPQGLAIPPHRSVVLAPDGDHLMFEALKRPLLPKEQFSATLVFEKAGAVPVTFTVEPIGARTPNGDASSRSGMNMKMN